MTVEEIKTRIDNSEFRYFTSRSSGPGGQNVNKVNTKVELRFDLMLSRSLTNDEKELILKNIGNRVTTEGYIRIVSQSERTQLQNKRKAEEKMYRLLANALTIKAERKATRPNHASKEKRVDEKKKRGSIKSLRKGPSDKDF